MLNTLCRTGGNMRSSGVLCRRFVRSGRWRKHGYDSAGNTDSLAEAWQLSRELGLDYINTDRPADVAAFLRAKGKGKSS